MNKFMLGYPLGNLVKLGTCFSRIPFCIWIWVNWPKDKLVWDLSKRSGSVDITLWRSYDGQWQTQMSPVSSLSSLFPSSGITLLLYHWLCWTIEYQVHHQTLDNIPTPTIVSRGNNFPLTSFTRSCSLRIPLQPLDMFDFLGTKFQMSICTNVSKRTLCDIFLWYFNPSFAPSLHHLLPQLCQV